MYPTCCESKIQVLILDGIVGKRGGLEAGKLGGTAEGRGQKIEVRGQRTERRIHHRDTENTENTFLVFQYRETGIKKTITLRG
jgi:hypothetical protein